MQSMPGPYVLDIKYGDDLHQMFRNAFGSFIASDQWTPELPRVADEFAGITYTSLLTVAVTEQDLHDAEDAGEEARRRFYDVIADDNVPLIQQYRAEIDRLDRMCEDMRKTLSLLRSSNGADGRLQVLVNVTNIPCSRCSQRWSTATNTHGACMWETVGPVVDADVSQLRETLIESGHGADAVRSMSDDSVRQAASLAGIPLREWSGLVLRYLGRHNTHTSKPDTHSVLRDNGTVYTELLRAHSVLTGTEYDVSAASQLAHTNIMMNYHGGHRARALELEQKYNDALGGNALSERLGGI